MTVRDWEQNLETIPDSSKKEKQPRPGVTQCTATAAAYFSLIQVALRVSGEL